MEIHSCFKSVKMMIVDRRVSLSWDRFNKKTGIHKMDYLNIMSIVERLFSVFKKKSKKSLFPVISSLNNQ